LRLRLKSNLFWTRVTWNRFLYVRADPVNRNDASGLCDVFLAGITMNPFENSAFDSFASEMMAGYSYSGGSILSGLADVAYQANFGPNAAKQVAIAAIMTASLDPGPITIFAFSGGAQSFATAMQYLVRARIAIATILPRLEEENV
jgi:hypothetical protein